MSKKLIVTSTILFFISGLCFAAFNDAFNSDVKSMGLVATGSTILDGPAGMIYNPAENVLMKRTAVSTAYSKPSLGWGDADVGIYSMFLNNPFHDNSMSMGFGVTYLQSNINYSELAGYLNLGVYYPQFLGTPVMFAWGINGKILSMDRGDPTKSYDPALRQMTITRNTADAGVIFEYNGYLLGVSQLNIIDADFGVEESWKVPQETRVGLGAKNVPFLKKFKISPAVEFSSRNGFDTLSAGANIYMLKMLDMQLGYSSDDLGFGFSVYLDPRPEEQEEEDRSSCLRIDVSWLYPISGIDSAGSPQIGLFYYFR